MQRYTEFEDLKLKERLRTYQAKLTKLRRSPIYISPTVLQKLSPLPFGTKNAHDS